MTARICSLVIFPSSGVRGWWTVAAKMYAPMTEIPYGYCHCGCGAKTRLAPANDPRHGHVKGQPVRFLKGHSHRGKVVSAETRAKLSQASSGPKRPGWKGDNASYGALHTWLRRHHPKTGRCERCAYEGRTDFALIPDGRPYTRNRADYQELCHRCNMRQDAAARPWRAGPRSGCPNGHPYDSATVLIIAGHRRCPICYRARKARQAQRERQRRSEYARP